MLTPLTPTSTIRDQFTLSRSNQSSGFKAQIYSLAYQVQRKILKKFIALSIYQRILASLAAVFVITSLTLTFVYNEKIFGFFAPYAAKWRLLHGGWLILWFLTFLAAFPPLMGYSTAVTVSGYLYGFPNGWIVVATATVCGSVASFIASRTILSNYVHRIVNHDHRFQALASTLEHDGLKVLCMIRLCPLPYSISNAAISTFPNIKPASFALATAIASPKLLVHVFIGSRMAVITDLGQNHHLDAKTKILNYFFIIAGIIFGAILGWVLYNRVMMRVHELDSTESHSDTFGTVRNTLLSSELDYRYVSEEASIATLKNDENQDLWEGINEIDEGSAAYHDEETTIL